MIKLAIIRLTYMSCKIVSRYQSLLELSLFVVFVGVYTYVINHRPNSDDEIPDAPAYLEVALYVFVFGYIFDDIRQVNPVLLRSSPPALIRLISTSPLMF